MWIDSIMTTMKLSSEESLKQWLKIGSSGDIISIRLPRTRNDSMALNDTYKSNNE